MVTENRGGSTQQSGGTTTSQSPQAIWDQVRQSISSPTDYLNFFRHCVQDAPAGVTKQQLLDSISDNYSGSGR